MEFTEADEGASVFDADRQKIGVVTEVRDGEAYVEPDPSLAEEIQAKLDWGSHEADDEAFALDSDWVDEREDGEILLRTRPLE
ncbi:PRC-barrel domain containing protein [Halorussus gelatinilyticus]|uniref:PRC-barrel domain containing protein n=1 Tax=Halorussus gelatinilyticus TaxID=2937524 RepID=A0A8U0IDN4_9EURY|nr:PRC-barrel domain containing protein [Halorussus gelatinilyticus]UPV99027.1 PRC-barrel domain containing protein [Halorussus gelatinilyticus]